MVQDGTAVQTHIELTRYERSALSGADRWVRRSSGIGDRAFGGVSTKTRWLIDGLLEREEIRERITTVTDEVLARLGDAVADIDATERPSLPITDPIARTEALRRVDREANRTHTSCVGAMTVEGIAAGVASMTPVTAVISLLPDLAAALTISTTSAARILSIYGVTAPGSTALGCAVQVAALATETDSSERRDRFSGLAEQLTAYTPDAVVAEDVSQLVAQQLAVRAMRETVEQTIRRMARRRLAAAIPVLGIAVHAVASGWLGGQVCEASRHLGRTVYLARSTGRPVDELFATASGDVVR